MHLILESNTLSDLLKVETQYRITYLENRHSVVLRTIIRDTEPISCLYYHVLSKYTLNLVELVTIIYMAFFNHANAETATWQNINLNNTAELRDYICFNELVSFRKLMFFSNSEWAKMHQTALICRRWMPLSGHVPMSSHFGRIWLPFSCPYFRA